MCVLSTQTAKSPSTETKLIFGLGKRLGVVIGAMKLLPPSSDT